MKKRVFTSLVLVGLLTLSLTGCKKEEAAPEVPVEEAIVPEEEAAPVEEIVKEVCSLCELEKECKTYLIEGKEYIVCDDDFNEFAHAMGLVDDADAPDEETELESTDTPASEPKSSQIPVCSLCEMEKECDTYEVDGQKYVVCPDCYNEFATAFGLNEDTAGPTCSLCEVQKVCGEYTADGQTYIVCPDCAEEFATAFEDTADKHTCSGCEEEKICGKYVVDGTTYYVCIRDFEEFAYGMGLY